MVSVMVIESDVFGRCVGGNMSICRGEICRQMALLSASLENIRDAFIGSPLVLLFAANGARYRMLFLRLLGVYR